MMMRDHSERSDSHLRRRRTSTSGEDQDNDNDDTSNSNEEKEEEHICRICFCEGTFVKRGARTNTCPDATKIGRSIFNRAGAWNEERLIKPCLCKGSMSYVHLSCLNRWRRVSSSPTSFYKCDQCGYEYNISRATICTLLENNSVVICTSLVTFVLALGLLGVTVQLIPLKRWNISPLPDLLYRRLQCTPIWRTWMWKYASLNSSITGGNGNGSIGRRTAASSQAVHNSPFNVFSVLAESSATCISFWRVFYYQWMQRVTSFISTLCDTLASGGIVLGFMGYVSLLYSIYCQDRNYLLRYVVPSLLAVVSQSGVASAARLFACLGVYAIHQEYYKKMLEAARQTMMTFGESILEIDDDDDEDDNDAVVEGDAMYTAGGGGDEGEMQDDLSNKKNNSNDTNTHTRHRKGPLRVVAYLVKRWLSANSANEPERNAT